MVLIGLWTSTARCFLDDDPSAKQPLAIIGEEIPEIIFKNINTIVIYNLGELSKVFI